MVIAIVVLCCSLAVGDGVMAMMLCCLLLGEDGDDCHGCYMLFTGRWGGDDCHCCNTCCHLADKDADDTTMTILLSVSGLYFANPKSTYFSLGKIQKDQVGQRDVFVPMTWLLGWKIEHDG